VVCKPLLRNVCCRKKNVGKPYEGKPHVRFAEEGQVNFCSLLYHPHGNWQKTLFHIMNYRFIKM